VTNFDDAAADDDDDYGPGGLNYRKRV